MNTRASIFSLAALRRTPLKRTLITNGLIVAAITLIACSASVPVFAQARPAPPTSGNPSSTTVDLSILEDALEDCHRQCNLTKGEEAVQCDRIAESCLYNIRFTPAIWWVFLRSMCMSDHDICMAKAGIKHSNCSIRCSTVFQEELKKITSTINRVR